MRIATSQNFDRPMLLMQQLSAQADATQTQIATGNRLAGPSSDPTAYLQLQGLKRATANDTAYTANIATAQTVIGQAGTALASVETQLQRAQEIATQIGNGTYSSADRETMLQELDSIREALFALANSRDVSGQPLFAGASSDAAYVKEADGTMRYDGSGDPPAIPIGDGTGVQASITGTRAFAAGTGDMFSVLAALSKAISDGGDVSRAAGTALTGIQTTLDNVGMARASLGARGARLDLESDRITQAGEAREATRSGLEDTDIATAVTQLQKTLTILQATQASFTKLAGLTLFDYLR